MSGGPSADDFVDVPTAKEETPTRAGSGPAATGDQVQDHHDDGDDEKQMDESARDMGDETEQPEDDEHDGNCV